MSFHLFLLMTSAMWNLEKWSATFTSLCRVWMVNGNWWPCSTHGSLETSWALVLFTSVTKIIFSLWTINFENCPYRSRLWNGFLGLAPRLRNIIFTPAYFLFHYFTYYVNHSFIFNNLRWWVYVIHIILLGDGLFYSNIYNLAAQRAILGYLILITNIWDKKRRNDHQSFPCLEHRLKIGLGKENSRSNK